MEAEQATSGLLTCRRGPSPPRLPPGDLQGAGAQAGLPVPVLVFLSLSRAAAQLGQPLQGAPFSQELH